MNFDNLDAISILKPEMFAYILDTEDSIEKIELEEKAKIRAKELGVLTSFNKRLNVYKKEDRQINPFRCDFPLSLNKDGMPEATIDNFLQILRNDINYAGALVWNELKDAPEIIIDCKYKEWVDNDDAELRRYIEKNYHMHNPKKLDDALRIVFNENKYNPIKKIIEATVWDGKQRINKILCKWLGAEDIPYTHEVSRLIFAGGIHRLYEPGCKFDEMPVLVGGQGCGKSTFVEWLNIDMRYFNDIDTIRGQRAMEALQGKWICEMSELKAFREVGDDTAKAFLSRCTDTYRTPYDRRASDHERRCIFIGTTNDEEFLRDLTGNRRYYPLICNKSENELFSRESEVKDDILQCWAEAKHLYDLGEMPTVFKHELKNELIEAREHATEEDYRIGIIKEFLLTKDKTCILQVWREAFKEFRNLEKKDSLEIGQILRKLGWGTKTGKEARESFKEYGQQRVFYNKKNKDKMPF